MATFRYGSCSPADALLEPISSCSSSVTLSEVARRRSLLVDVDADPRLKGAEDEDEDEEKEEEDDEEEEEAESIDAVESMSMGYCSSSGTNGRGACSSLAALLSASAEEEA